MYFLEYNNHAKICRNLMQDLSLPILTYSVAHADVVIYVAVELGGFVKPIKRSPRNLAP